MAHCFFSSVYSLQPALASYMGYPRVQFSGSYRTDLNSKNNDPCNFIKSDEIFIGSNNFEFFDASVTSVVYADGRETQNDALVGQKVISNVRRPLAKFSDLDVDCQNASTVHGLKISIKW